MRRFPLKYHSNKPSALKTSAVSKLLPEQRKHVAANFAVLDFWRVMLHNKKQR